MKSLHFLYLTIALSLISCANLPSKNIPQTFDQNDSQGLIIGAFAIKNEKPIFNGYGLYHTSTDFAEKPTVDNRVWFVPEQMVKMKLKPDFFDDKKGVYTVSSYQFLYKKKGVTENEETGKVSPTTTIVSQRFKTTPLPQVWIDNVRQEVKSGEELYFFDVIAKDAQGRVMYAPDFKIKVL